MEWDLETLADEIVAGRCVAFVGAGFSAPVSRPWRELLIAVASEADGPVRAQVEGLLAANAVTARSFEVAAQLLEDTFKEAPTEHLLAKLARHTGRPTIAESTKQAMHDRKRRLLEIPFSAILTTNFDEQLGGAVLDAATYGDVLREGGRRWWNAWGHDPRVYKLHGDLQGDAGVTLSRRGYRTRLYTEPGYLHVLRSLFLTKTVLFIGFSFTDEYLNELRSECLAYLAREGKTPTLAYALLNDVPEAIRNHYRDHEGIEVFDYDTKGVAEADQHAPFDRFVELLHERTNPAAVLGRRLAGKRILWVDPTDRNDRGHEFLRRAAKGTCTIDTARSPADAMTRMHAGDPCNYDLVITRWGHHRDAPADALVLLEAMRSGDRRAPVVIFASGNHAEENRERALRLGALEYTAGWETLYRVLDSRFGGPP